MQALHTTYRNALDDLVATPTCRTAPGPRSGRPRGSKRTQPSMLLRSLAEENAAGIQDVVTDALERLWFSGFCAGAATVAPDRVRHCACCAEPFLAGHRREVYCGARCRNTAVKRRYRARLRARARAERGER